MKIRKTSYGVILLFVSLLITSCGVWKDFTVYFNTYYNAKTLFDQTEGDILKQKKDIFAFRDDQQNNSSTTNSNAINNTYASNSNNTNAINNTNANNSTNANAGNNSTNLFQNQTTTTNSTKTSTSSIADLNKVIEKCSKILQYEKTSSYFEDALFITGKAFFYEGEYPKAQRKFIELAGLSETKYALENKLWLAKTNLQMRNFDEGLRLIEEVKSDAIKAKNDKLFMDASISKIGFLIYRLEYQNAINECIDYLKVSKDDEVNALVYYELGKIYLLVEDYKNAFDSFNSALDFSPTFDVEFECRFESARLMKKLNKIDESAKAFEAMRYQGKFKDKLDRILIELSQIYYDKKQSEKALLLLKDVDTTYKQTRSSGIASMKIAEIYEKVYRDYDSSYKYFNKASLSNVPKDIKTEADKNSKTISNYFALKKMQKELNMQITYRNKPQYFYQDSVDYAYVFHQYEDKINKMTDSLKNVNDSRKSNSAAATTTSLSFDQVSKLYIQQEEDFKLRRRSSTKYVDPQILLIAKGIYQKPQKSKLSVDSLQIMISQNLYNIGSLLYSELEAPDSSYIYFKRILNEFPKKTIATQTMFSLGIYYETNGDSLKADSMFKYIYYNYEKDPIRNAAGQKLGLIKKEDENLSLKNNDPVEKLYIQAEQLLYDKKYQEAVDSFQVIYRNSPKSKYAPKSIYYCGLIYEENLKMYDSAATKYGLLQAKEYADSAPAKAVKDKYIFYKTENDKLKAEADKKNKELAAQKELQLQKENKLKDNPEPPKPVQDVNQKTGTNVQTEPANNKGKEINQPVPQNSPVKRDSLNLLNEKSPPPNQEEVPFKKNMQKDTTNKHLDP